MNDFHYFGSFEISWECPQRVLDMARFPQIMWAEHPVQTLSNPSYRVFVNVALINQPSCNKILIFSLFSAFSSSANLHKAGMQA